MVNATRSRWRLDETLLRTLRDTEVEVREREVTHECSRDYAVSVAYGDAEPIHTDPETLAFNPGSEKGTPPEWWAETRLAL